MINDVIRCHTFVFQRCVHPAETQNQCWSDITCLTLPDYATYRPGLRHVAPGPPYLPNPWPKSGFDVHKPSAAAAAAAALINITFLQSGFALLSTEAPAASTHDLACPPADMPLTALLLRHIAIDAVLAWCHICHPLGCRHACYQGEALVAVTHRHLV